MHEFELNGNNLLSLQPLVDSILDSIQQCTQISLLDEVHSPFTAVSCLEVFGSEDFGSYRSLLKS